MALSRDSTAITLWREATRDLGDVSGISQFEKYALVNRAVKTISGQFYDLMAISYMTSAYATLVGTAKYETVAAGTYVAATRILTMDTPSTSLDASEDIEKVVMFRIGTAVYLGWIESVVSTNAFVFKSTNYPATNGTPAEVMICGTTLSSSVISLAGLRIMRSGANIRIELESSVDGANIKFASTREVATFRNTGINANTIIWALTGDSIVFALGASLATDLPDGTPIEISIIYLKGIMQQRMGMPKENNEARIEKLVGDMYRTFGQEASAEVIKEKVIALR